jgi:hypothetical protein
MDYEQFQDVDGNNHIAINNPDGTRTTFPADENNPEYQAFLKRDEPQASHLSAE